MFDRIGTKIKGLAATFAWIGIIAAVLTGIFCMLRGDIMVLIGMCIAIVGAIFSWIFSFVLYGFGELIEKTCIIEERLSIHPSMSISEENADNELIELLRKGIISEAEYKEAMNEK